MKSRSVVPMRIAKLGYIIMSVIFCAIGIFFIIFPELSALFVSRALGVIMMVFGCIKLVGYFSRDLFRLAFQYDLGFGILLIVLGLIVLLKAENVLNFIFIAIGIAVLADALFKLQISVDSKKFGIQSWWLILSIAILTSIIGLMLVFRPWESAAVLTVMLGIAMLFEGILNLCVAISTIKIVKYQKPDVIDVEYTDVNE